MASLEVTLQFELQFCPQTGRPYFLDHDGEKDFQLEKCVVLEEHRRFLQMEGEHFPQYLQNLPHDTRIIAVEHFLESIPTVEQMEWSSAWTEEDDRKFREALRFLNGQSPNWAITFYHGEERQAFPPLHTSEEEEDDCGCFDRNRWDSRSVS